MPSINCCTMPAANSKAACRHVALKSARCSPCLARRGKIIDASATYNRGVTMESDRFERWLQNIYSTQDKEISCSECFDLVSGFVELELAKIARASCRE